MKRIIKDYTNVTDDQLRLITKQYPDGIDSDHLISFTGPKGEYVKAIEVRTEDTIFLFKISGQMLAKIDSITDDDFDLGDFSDYIKDDGTFVGSPKPTKPAKPVKTAKGAVDPDDEPESEPVEDEFEVDSLDDDDDDVDDEDDDNDVDSDSDSYDDDDDEDDKDDDDEDDKDDDDKDDKDDDEDY